MARINVEDTLWSDPRFMRLAILLGDEFKAAGVMLIGWKTAQRYWCPDRAPIPENVFQSLRLPEALIESGLAERTSGGIRLRGSEEHFSWWFEKRKAGSKGGKKSAQNRSDHSSSAQAVLGATTAQPSESNPLSLTPSPPLTLFPDPPLSQTQKAKFDFERVYAKYPCKQGKIDGLELFNKQIKTAADYALFEQAVDKYAAYHSRPLSPEEFRPHPKHFDTFMRKERWRECLEPGFGDPPPLEMRQAGRRKTHAELVSDANQELYRKIEAGEV